MLMKKIKNVRFNFFLVPLVFLVVQKDFAGVVSLTDSEILKLQALVKSSPEAGMWAQTLERQAQEALGQEPHPIAQIQTAGKLKGSAEKTETEEALKDMPRLRALEMAYALTGREDYRQKAEAFVLAWAQTCQPPENPIDGTNLETLLESYDLIRPRMAATNQTMVDGWVRSVAQTLLASDDPRKGTYWNNWKSHRLKIVAMAAFTLGDSALENQVLETLKALLGKNLNADGTTLDFLERDALHYQVYDLEPLLRTAMLYQRAGRGGLYDLKTDSGASIHQCVAFIVPFATGQKTHAEYVHTTVKFDLQRAQNNEKGHAIGALFEPKAALKCLELAQFFEPGLKGLVGSLAGKPDSAYPTLQILLNEASRPSANPVPTP